MSRASIEQVRAGLLGRVRELADTLAPDQARVEGNDRWSLNPTRPDRHANSFKIDIAGPNRGRWHEFNGDDGGDLINLIAYCRFAHLGHYRDGRSEAVKAAIRWAADWLGLSDADPERLAALERQALAARAAHARDAERANVQMERKSEAARKHWFAAPVHSVFEHPVSRRYLEEVRGIRLADLPHLPRALRFEPDGPPSNWLIKMDRETGEVFPSIIACMASPAGRVRAAHRVFLAPDGSDKADIRVDGRAKAKFMYGPAAACAIRLSKGKHGVSPEEAARRGLGGETLAVSEGWEDGLSWACMEHEHRVWAKGSLNFGQLHVPDSVSRVIILGQNDTNTAAIAAVDREVAKLIDRLKRPVEVARPLNPKIKDWNDLWRGV